MDYLTRCKQLAQKQFNEKPMFQTFNKTPSILSIDDSFFSDVNKSMQGRNYIWHTKVILNKHSMRVYNYSNGKPLFHLNKKKDKGDVTPSPVLQSLISSNKTLQRDIESKIPSVRTAGSLNRSRNRLYDIVDCNTNHYTKFLTLTFKENLQDFDSASKCWNLFSLRFERLFGEKIKYARVPEFQKRGAIHFHCVIFNSRKLDYKMLKKCWTFGSVDIKLVDKTTNVAKYVSKYITKDMCDIPSSKKIVCFSRGLIQPRIYYFPDWKYDSQVVNMTLKNVSFWDSKYDASYSVCYMFYSDDAVSPTSRNGGRPPRGLGGGGQHKTPRGEDPCLTDLA